MQDVLRSLMSPQVIWVLIPLAAIIGVAVNKGLKSHYAHKERLARIEAGLEEEGEE